MMERYDDAIAAAETATNSHGSATRENQRYLESHEARLNRVKNSWTETTIEMRKAFLDDALISFATVATSGIEKLTALVERFGILPPVMAVVGLAFSGLVKNMAFSAFEKVREGVGGLSKRFIELSTTGRGAEIAMKRGAGAANLYAAGVITADGASKAFVGTLKLLGRTLLPMMAFSAIGWGLSKLTESFAESKRKADELERSLKEIEKTQEEAFTNPDLNIDELINKYKRLNSERSNSGNWDNEKEQEYIDIQNELGDILPGIVKGIDDKGNKHLDSTANIKEEARATRELVRANQELAIEKAKERYDEGIDNVKTMADEVKQLEKRRKTLKNERDAEEKFHKEYGKTRGENAGDVQPESIEEIKKRYNEEIKMMDNKVIVAQNRLSSVANMLGVELHNHFLSGLNILGMEVSEEAKGIGASMLDLFDMTELGDKNKTEIFDFVQEYIGLFTELDKRIEQHDHKGFDELMETIIEVMGEFQEIEIPDGFIVSLDDVLEAIDKGISLTDYMSGLLGEEGDAHGDVADEIDEHREALDELTESYNNAIDSISGLNKILDDLNEGNGLSVEHITTLMEKHEDLLPYIHDETVLREKIIEKIEEDKNVAVEAIKEKMMMNKEFFDNLHEGNNKLFKRLAEEYEVDLTNFQTLAEAKKEIEAKLLKDLAGAWAEFFKFTEDGMAEASLKSMESGDGAHSRINYQDTRQLEETRRAADRYNKAYEGLNETIDGILNVDFKSLGEDISKTGSEYEKNAKSADKANKAAKEYQMSKYIADEYALALERINLELERQNRLTSEFPKHSQEYRDSLNKEIEILKRRGSILKQQSKDLANQISSGNIAQTGVVRSGSVWDAPKGGSGSQSVADYYLSQFTVTSKYGGRNSPDGIGSTNHKGIDLANGRAGDAVKALSSGKVVNAYYDKYRGNVVVLQHDDGIISRYQHLQDGSSARAGQRVSAGDTIGRVGTTGSSTGNHLHLEIESGGKTFDPLPYLKNLRSGSSTSAAQIKSEASSQEAQRLSDLDRARSELIGLESEILSVGDRISDLYFAVVESHLASFDIQREQLGLKLAEIDYFQTRYGEDSIEWVNLQLEREEVLKEQSKLHRDSVKWLEKEIKTNKNLTREQRMRLDDLLIERQTELWNLERQVLDERIKMANQVLDVYKQTLNAQKDAALNAVDNLLKEIDEKEREADYKKRLEKEQRSRQEILDEMSLLSIDDSAQAKKRLEELAKELEDIDEAIEEMQDQKALEDRKNALNEQKDEINDHYDNLLNDEQAFAKMRSDIIKGNTSSIEKHLSGFYKKLDGLTEELGSSVVKNLQHAIDQMNAYITDPNFQGMKIPHFDTGGMVRTSSSRGGLIVAHDKEIVLKQDDSARLLESIKLSRDFMSRFRIPERPKLDKGEVTNNVTYDIDLNVENMNGTKEDARTVLNEIVRGVENRGGKWK